MKSTKATDFPIHGSVAPGFEAVRDVFTANFIDGADVGAGFCVVRNDEILIDLWGGHKDQAMNELWQADTLVNVYSTTKGLASFAFAWAVEQGHLGYADEVRSIWPEFVAGKDGLSVAQFLSHQSGVPGVSETITVADLYDWDKMCRLLAAQAPFWQPGIAAGYHAIVWGYLAGELVRRTTNRTMGEIFNTEIAGCLGADAFIGLPENESARVAAMIGPNRARIKPRVEDLAGLTVGPHYEVALQNPVIRPYQDASSLVWQQAEIAAANGQATAKGIARIYAAGANGGLAGDQRILAADTVAQMCIEESCGGKDLVLDREMRRARGFILNSEDQYGPNESAFGHAGAGGSVGFADPVANIGIGYVMNQMQTNIDNDTRGGRLVKAVYACGL